jgi:type II secretory ATPase GspE/PulE/Tfp pilus assembly ATPase PilB-like protein
VRRICDSCREAYTPELETWRELGIEPPSKDKQILYKAVGCKKCSDRGYKGRTGIFELLLMTPRIQEMALQGVDSNQIKREARKFGMRTLREDGAHRAMLGLTSAEEILRVTRNDMEEEFMG